VPFIVLIWAMSFAANGPAASNPAASAAHARNLMMQCSAVMSFSFPDTPIVTFFR
jgi:hypothetical protein